MRLNPENPSIPLHTQFYLPSGLIGLSELRRFELGRLAEEMPFLSMQTINAPLSFMVLPATRTDYPIDLDEHVAEEMGLLHPSDALALNIVTVHSIQPLYITANFRAPIVLNKHTKVGRQLIVNCTYSVEHPLVDERPARCSLC